MEGLSMSERERARAPTRPSTPTSRNRIVDQAIALAEERGWDNVRLHDVAERLGLSLAEVADEFRDLDAVANAWFARARDRMLRTPVAEPPGMPPPERLELVMMVWFDALAPHREVTGEMIGEKLYASHPHHWVPMIFDLSRLIHWFLDAARIRSTGRRRRLAEIGLTATFLLTLRVWLRDDSEGQEISRAFLRRRLAMANRLLARLG
jgi:AcrR family transcriptional regulator